MIKTPLLYLLLFFFSIPAWAATTWVQTDFRFRNDDGSETAATWRAAADSNITYTLSPFTSGHFRIRIAAKQTGTTSAALTGRLYVSKNGGAYAQASSSSTNGLKVVSSSNFTDNAATTQQLSSGTFIAGKMDDVDGTCTATSSMPQNNVTDHEYMLSLDYMNVANGDYFQFEERNSTTAFTTYTNVGQITVRKVIPLFPSSMILDNFNRADEDPLSDGGQYAVVHTFKDAGGIGVPYGTGGSCGGGFTWAKTFGPNAEVFVKIANGGTNGDAEVFIYNQDASHSYGYETYSGSTSGGCVLVDDTTVIIDLSSLSYASGDIIGLQLIGNTVIAFKNGVVVGFTTDTTLSARTGTQLSFSDYCVSGTPDRTFSYFGGGNVGDQGRFLQMF